MPRVRWPRTVHRSPFSIGPAAEYVIRPRAIHIVNKLQSQARSPWALPVGWRNAQATARPEQRDEMLWRRADGHSRRPELTSPGYGYGSPDHVSSRTRRDPPTVRRESLSICLRQNRTVAKETSDLAGGEPRLGQDFP